MCSQLRVDYLVFTMLCFILNMANISSVFEKQVESISSGYNLELPLSVTSAVRSCGVIWCSVVWCGAAYCGVR